MRIAIFLGHPAHFHFLKNTAAMLKQKNIEVDFVIKKKDILEELLKKAGYSYYVIRNKERVGNSIYNMIISTLLLEWKMLCYFVKRRPKLLIGTCFSFTGRIAGIPVFVCNEDDVDVVPKFANLSYPFATNILSPRVCDNGKWEYKSIKYDGYQKLAYLHPSRFTPDRNIVNSYFDSGKKYFLLRFAKLKAHHDDNAEGISSDIARQLIKILEPHGDIYITSERELEPEFEKYRLHINPLDIHHVMFYSHLYIGDSQSMAVEAAILGVPSIRFNSFVGKIGVLEELEHKYNLSISVHSSCHEELISNIKIMLNTPNVKELWKERREIMLKDKIDVTSFLTEFIEQKIFL